MAAELTGTITVRFVSDNDEWCHVIGKPSDDHMPIFGCDLEEGQEEKLREWLMRINIKKEIEKDYRL